MRVASVHLALRRNIVQQILVDKQNGRILYFFVKKLRSLAAVNVSKYYQSLSTRSFLGVSCSLPVLS